MPAADETAPFDPAELDRLFAPFLAHDRVLLAVSGGPDSTVLLLLAHRWRAARAAGPVLLVATVDHALRVGSAQEASEVGRLSARLNLSHAVLNWSGEKPATGLQEAARAARYALLAHHAKAHGAAAIAFAHTRDDQAETVLFRLARGSGLAGLAAMRSVSRGHGMTLLRPFLDVPKARLIAVAEAEGAAYVRDPSNTDPRFTRPRLRKLAPALAAEGLDAQRLATLARRMARAEAALADAVRAAEAGCVLERGERLVRLDASALLALPEEISLRMVIAACSACASEGEVELAKAERLHAALMDAARDGGTLSRTLAGAQLTLRAGEISIRQAPERRRKSTQSRQIHTDPGTRPWQARARHLD